MKIRPRTGAAGRVTRRRFIGGAVAAGAASTAARRSTRAQSAGGILGLDHVAVPMQNTAAMLAFYRALGLEITETPRACSVHIGEQMINFHRPELWQDPSFTLRAPGSRPPAGDFCVVWGGTLPALQALLKQVGAPVEEGPVERRGGRRATGSSVYTRDPDGNLVEFILYPR